MPNKKLSDLPEWTTTPASDDLLLWFPSTSTIQHYKIKYSTLQSLFSSTLVKETGSVSGATSGNGQSTGHTFSGTPPGDVMVFIAGVKVEFAEDKTKDCYASVDGGTTARAPQSGDTLYWNGTINGNRTDVINTLGNLAGGELIEIFY